MPKNHDIIEIEVMLEHETPKAYLVKSITTGKKSWVPKSVVELDGHLMQIPASMAEDKELV